MSCVFKKPACMLSCVRTYLFASDYVSRSLSCWFCLFTLFTHSAKCWPKEWNLRYHTCYVWGFISTFHEPVFALSHKQLLYYLGDVLFLHAVNSLNGICIHALKSKIQSTSQLRVQRYYFKLLYKHHESVFLF